MEWAVAVIGAAIVGLQVWQDMRTYPRFKALTDTAERQRMMRYWLADSFVRYGVVGVVGLFVLGREGALLAMPLDIAAARDVFAARLGWSGAEVRTLGYVGAAVLSVGVALAALAPFLMAPPKAGELKAVGDILAMIPRNRGELRWGALLSINAGVAEEIFFRLAAPLAFFAVSGEFLLSFLLAAGLFGFAHAYQGAAGVLVTFVVGLVMTVLYLATGQIWVAMAIHALIDLRAMVATPLALWRAAPG